MADPWLRTISAPNMTRTNITGNNQYFFLINKNPKNSFIKFIFKTEFSLYIFLSDILSSGIYLYNSFNKFISYLINLYLLAYYNPI